MGLDTNESAGQSYLNDMNWAREYASQNRLEMMKAALRLLNTRWGVEADYDSLIHTDHNHVQLETHFEKQYLVHRKGAQCLKADQPGIVPGSMGTCSFLVAGRGCPEASQFLLARGRAEA